MKGLHEPYMSIYRVYYACPYRLARPQTNSVLDHFGDSSVVDLSNGSIHTGDAAAQHASSALTSERASQITAALAAAGMLGGAAQQAQHVQHAQRAQHARSAAATVNGGWAHVNEQGLGPNGSSHSKPPPESPSAGTARNSPSGPAPLTMIREEPNGWQKSADGEEQRPDEGPFLDLRPFMNSAPFAIRCVAGLERVDSILWVVCLWPHKLYTR